MAIAREDAIRRAAIIDAELGWPRGLALGRMMMIWNHAQAGDGQNEAKRRLILEWACVDAQDGDLFIETCCIRRKKKGDLHVHFLESRGNDRYFIVGNPEELDRIEKHRAGKSAGGKASAEARKATTGTAVPAGAKNHPSRPSTEQTTEQPFEQTTEQMFEHDPEQSFEQPPNPTPTPTPTPFTTPIPSPTTDDSREAVESSVGVGGPLSPADLGALWRAAGLPHRPLGPVWTLKLRVALDELPDRAHWAAVFARVKATPYLTGQVPTKQKPGGFRASLVWAVENHEAIMAGTYDPHEPQKGARPPPACLLCADRGKRTADQRGGPVVDAFRCQCPAGEKHPERELWDDSKLAEWEPRPPAMDGDERR